MTQAPVGRGSGGYIARLAPDLIFPVNVLPPKRVQASFVATAAGDYAANDIISQSATDTLGTALMVPGVVANPGDVATLYKVVARSSDASLLCRLRLHFFDRPLLPADAELDDNAVFTITTLDALRHYLGYVDLPAFVSRSIGVFAQADAIREEFKTLTGRTDLYVVVQTLDAETNEAAGMTMEFDFYVG